MANYVDLPVIGGSGGGAVSSVFTRTGAVVATTGDYTISQITNGQPLTWAPTTVSYASTITLTGSTSAFYRTTLTGNANVAIPSGSSDGAKLYWWVNASGGNYTLTLNAYFKIPISSSLTSALVIANGSKSKILFEYDASQNGGQWELTSYISGF